MRTRNLVRRTSRRFQLLLPRLVVFSIVSACLAFASDRARAATAGEPCSQWISSGPNDPPMLGVPISMEWDWINQVYIGTYLMNGGDKPLRTFRCDTNEEL